MLIKELEIGYINKDNWEFMHSEPLTFIKQDNVLDKMYEIIMINIEEDIVNFQYSKIYLDDISKNEFREYEKLIPIEFKLRKDNIIKQVILLASFDDIGIRYQNKFDSNNLNELDKHLKEARIDLTITKDDLY